MGSQKGMDAANRLKFTLRRWHFILLMLAPWLFCSPLMAQQPYKKQIELDFAVGVKTTHYMGWDVLDEMKRSNMSLGVFAEGRWGIGGSNSNASFIRFRAAFDDWKRDTYSDYPQHSTAVQRIRGTIGAIMNMRKAGPNDAYCGAEVGISHWDIDSTHPLYGKEKYNTLAIGLFAVYQMEHIFLEITSEHHSKGPRRDSPDRGYTKEEKPRPLKLGAGLSLGVSQGVSFGAGWKF